MTQEVITIGPHPGPQTTFLKTSADIAVFGGQAGGGKTRCLLMEGVRYTDNPGFGAVIFRRTSPQITNEGGLWDESMEFYPDMGGTPKHTLDWVFPSGANVGFRHLQYETDKLAWQGSQITLIGFDELTHFTETQFFYLLSRNRSTCGIRPYVRATCNPINEDDEVGGWVHKLLQWWIDPVSGFAIPERSGVIRWFIRRAGEIVWADTKQELMEKYGNPRLPDDHDDQPCRPKSLTFIQAKLSDNPTMAQKNPDYKANLLSLPEVERQRLADGNWNAKPQAGMFFKVGKIQIVDALPAGLKYCRAWDLAHTDGNGDWTVGGKIGVEGTGDNRIYYIVDVVRGQWEANYRDSRISQCAEQDDCLVRLPEDPSAGKSEAARLIRMLAGYNVKAVRVYKDKLTRATGFASQLNAGNVRMLRAPWNQGLMQRLDAFPSKGIPDDEIDALGDAFQELSRPSSNALVGQSAPDDTEQRAENQFAALVADDYVRDLWERITKEEFVCPQWKDSYAMFRQDIGERPSKQHVVKLRDKFDAYKPGNCFWGIEGQEEPKPPVRKIRAFVA